MTERWFEATADGVTRLVPHVAWSALNPWRPLVAIAGGRSLQRDGAVDARRVRVLDIDEGREVAAFEGRAGVRSLAWTSPEHLLVIRDTPGGDELALHEIPDGGVVARATAFEFKGLPLRVERSSAGSTLLVSVGWTLPREGVFARVFALPSLDPLAAVAPPGGRRVRPLGSPALHPDGAHVALCFVDDLIHVAVAPAEVTGAPRNLLSFEGAGDTPRWLDARSLVVFRGDDDGARGEVLVLECDDAFREARVRATYASAGAANGDGLVPLGAPHPDRDRLLVGSGWSDDVDAAMPIEVLRLADGARTRVGTTPAVCAESVCWVLGGAAVAFIDERRSLALAVPQASERAVAVPLGEQRGVSVSLLDTGGLGGGLVMVESIAPRDERALTFVDAARILAL